MPADVESMFYVREKPWHGLGTMVEDAPSSISAPAIEFQKEGQVFGIGCKIFTIAGPVILYGLASSSGLGLIYYILTKIGVV